MLRKVANCPFSPRQSPSSSGFRLLAVGHVGTRRRRLRRSRAEAPVRLQQGSVGPVAPTVGVRLAGQAKRRRRACLAGARTAAARAQAQSSSTRCPVEMRPSSGASCAHHVRSKWSTIPSVFCSNYLQPTQLSLEHRRNIINYTAQCNLIILQFCACDNVMHNKTHRPQRCQSRLPMSITLQTKKVSELPYLFHNKTI